MRAARRRRSRGSSDGRDSIVSNDVGIDPARLRELGTAAGELAAAAESVRAQVLDILVTGDLASLLGPSLAELAEEMDLLTRLSAQRAAAIEEAGTGWVSPLAGQLLERSLNDGRGSDGMTSGFALETLRVHRGDVDTDGDGSVSEAEVTAAVAATGPSVRAAAAWLAGHVDEHAAVASDGQSPRPSMLGGPLARPSVEERAAAVNALGPADVDGLVTEWTAATVAGAGAAAFSILSRSVPLDDPYDVTDMLLGTPGPTTTVIEPRRVAVPDLDGPWLASLGDLAPTGTAAIVLHYREEEVDFAYTVDPVPDLPQAVDSLVWAGDSALLAGVGLGKSLAVKLSPIGIGASLGVGAYEFVDWVAPDAESRQDTTAIFDVEYRDPSGNVLDVQTRMAVQRSEVTGPMFGGPAVVVLPHRPKEE